MSSKWYHNNTAKTDILAHSSRDFANVIIAVGGPPGVRRARPACVSGDWPPRSTRSQGSRARLPPPSTPPPPHAPRREKRELVCACAIRRATQECGGDRITPAYLPAVVGPPVYLGRSYTAVLLSVVYTYNIITIIIIWSLVTVRLLPSIMSVVV